MGHWSYMCLSYLCIFMNSILITYYTPLNDLKSTKMKIITILDIITTIFFCTEILGKIIICGFINNGPKSLLRVPFNVIEFIITIVDVFTNIFSFSSNYINTVINLIRVLRVLKLINMHRDFRQRTKAIMHALPKIIQTMLICVMIIVMFAIIGVQLFKDGFYYCASDNVLATAEIYTRYDCMNQGGEWRSQDIGFDNVLMGCMTLFEMFTGKSWTMLIFVSDFIT